MCDLDYGVIATIFAALIGAGALIYIFNKTSENVHNNLKADKIAEAKRDEYLGLVSQLQKYIFSIYSFKLSKQKQYLSKVLYEYQILNTLLRRCTLISEPKTKLKIMNLVIKITLNFKEIIPNVMDWYSFSQSLEETDKKERVQLDIKIFHLMKVLGDEGLALELFLRDELNVINDPQIDSEIEIMMREFQENALKVLENQQLEIIKLENRQ